MRQTVALVVAAALAAVPLTHQGAGSPALLAALESSTCPPA